MKLNYIVNQIVLMCGKCAENIYSQHAHMACPNEFIVYMNWYISPKGLYLYITYFYLRKP